MHEEMRDKMNSKPLEPEHLRDHLRMVTIWRRPFVLTSDDIGPHLLIKGRKGDCQIYGIKYLNLLLVRISEIFVSLVMNWDLNRA